MPLCSSFFLFPASNGVKWDNSSFIGLSTAFPLGVELSTFWVLVWLRPPELLWTSVENTVIGQKVLKQSIESDVPTNVLLTAKCTIGNWRGGSELCAHQLGHRCMATPAKMHDHLRNDLKNSFPHSQPSTCRYLAGSFMRFLGVRHRFVSFSSQSFPSTTEFILPVLRRWSETRATSTHQKLKASRKQNLHDRVAPWFSLLFGFYIMHIGDEN